MQNQTQTDHACSGLGPSVCGRCEDWREKTKAWQGDPDAEVYADAAESRVYIIPGPEP